MFDAVAIRWKFVGDKPDQRLRAISLHPSTTAAQAYLEHIFALLPDGDRVGCLTPDLGWNEPIQARHISLPRKSLAGQNLTRKNRCILANAVLLFIPTHPKRRDEFREILPHLKGQTFVVHSGFSAPSRAAKAGRLPLAEKVASPA